MLSKQTPRVHPLLPPQCVYVPSRVVMGELYLATQYEVLRSSFHGGFHQAEYPHRVCLPVAWEHCEDRPMTLQKKETAYLETRSQNCSGEPRN